ncbi:cytochrome P450 [Streptomyces sp. NK08204]|uniref:cytochrome P450 n=1 Tax=Streptomyces sp. NK08204 TaxID=2873260 RepID=UPI001CECFDFF|nr:cytochrome P450 [Streptomyces sp. NK08204]
MTTTTRSAGRNTLPDFPSDRPVHCPFAPPDVYTDWRAKPGLGRVRLWNGSTPWVVTRYQDIRIALADPRLSADIYRPGMPVIRPGSEAVTGQATGFARMDDPEHARLRRMVTKDFTARRVEELRPRIQDCVHDALDSLIDKGCPADLVHHFALPVSSSVICLLLGVPYDDHRFFQEQTALIGSLDSSTETAAAARSSFLDYLRRLLEQKEREPADDMISRLLVEQVAEGKLSREELTVMIRMMLSTGHETVGNTIALGALALLLHPDQLERVRDTDDPDVVANAVEELLRYTSVVDNPVIRVATEDITLGGQLVRAGEGLVISLLTGNRDPDFTDDPETLDIDRDIRDHLAFGHGIHQCPGQRLARLEIQLALSALLNRLPTLRLAVPFEQVSFRADMSIFGLHELPVAW